MASKPPPSVVLRIELRRVTPLVWRRVRLPHRLSLAGVHEVLQIVMGWQNAHLHEFRFDSQRVGILDEEALDDPPQDEQDWTILQVQESGVSEFEYEYDFGDAWIHRLVFEPQRRSPGPAPLCLAGENASPPENVGGAHGYAQFLQALGDASHEDHAAHNELVGGIWDPKGFDLNWINRALRATDHWMPT